MRSLFVVVLVLSHTLVLGSCAWHAGRTGVSVTVGPAQINRGDTVIKSEVTEDLYKMVGVMIEAGISILRFVMPAGLQPASAVAEDDSVHHEHEPGVEVAPLMLYQDPYPTTDNAVL